MSPCSDADQDAKPVSHMASTGAVAEESQKLLAARNMEGPRSSDQALLKS